MRSPPMPPPPCVCGCAHPVHTRPHTRNRPNLNRTGRSCACVRPSAKRHSASCVRIRASLMGGNCSSRRTVRHTPCSHGACEHLCVFDGRWLSGSRRTPHAVHHTVCVRVGASLMVVSVPRQRVVDSMPLGARRCCDGTQGNNQEGSGGSLRTL